ncbi:DUF1801 domain-containing protein [Maritimibacter alexandrii]|uniref:DUF1801 domain-containing protein n=1 Tax=Maritimibacter alexandrii TaxID=2570355 RepID=UPI0011089B21|nr:DUF1801 domain-containing protein [Maritimibacter alexandrii]
MTDADDWFAALDPAQAETLGRLRGLILGSADGIKEEIKWRQPCYSRNKLFCYLQKSKSHVTLGFQQGARMPDAPSLLEGAGKELRHVRFTPGADIPEEAVKTLIGEALALDGA